MNNKCPCCGAEMTPGVIQSRSSVYWSREADSVAAFSFLDDDAFPLADQGGATLGGASAPAYNCTRCKKSSWTIPFAICPPDFSLFPPYPLAKPERSCYHTLRQQGSSPERAESGLSSP